MNREIKFRIWDGFEFHYASISDLLNGYPKDTSPCHEDDFVYQEYTGLKDKNGKEIFEGDIVKYTHWYREWDTVTHESIAEVKSFNGGFYPIPNEHRCDEDGWYSYGDKDFEVIGNIYENPKLLKK